MSLSALLFAVVFTSLLSIAMSWTSSDAFHFFYLPSMERYSYSSYSSTCNHFYHSFVRSTVFGHPVNRSYRRFAHVHLNDKDACETTIVKKIGNNKKKTKMKETSKRRSKNRRGIILAKKANEITQTKVSSTNCRDELEPTNDDQSLLEPALTMKDVNGEAISGTNVTTFVSSPRTTITPATSPISDTPVPISSYMPPWLSKYEDDTNHYLQPIFNGENSVISGSGCDNHTITHLDQNDHPDRDLPSHLNTESIASTKLDQFAFTMSSMLTKSHYSSRDIKDVIHGIRAASRGDERLLIGCVDFLYLMLSLEEGAESRTIENYSDASHDMDVSEDDIYENLIIEQGGRSDEILYPAPKHHAIMTREVLLAAAFHYCDCVRARRAGMNEYVRIIMEAEGVPSSAAWEDLTSSTSTQLAANGKEMAIDQYGEETVRIVEVAARLKRAEVMASTVKSGNASGQSALEHAERGLRKSLQIDKSSSNASSHASLVRSFLLTLSDDWRALVIRSAASLYRLRGIINERHNHGTIKSLSSRIVYPSASMQTARDALRVYAPLAQRMGMQRLKSEIENTAFRILYPRQYDVASALHDRDIQEMQDILRALEARIESLLRCNDVFMNHAENVEVSSRVKEPYSLWKKILRIRRQTVGAQCDNDKPRPSNSTFLPTTSLSAKWIPDAIALRVILRGRRMQTEDEESLRTKEKMLCYYALRLIGDVWPPSKSNVAKDYIKSPKPNGYQSLHYTAALVIGGDEWPFEVQIRSEEMHRIAEYGVAAHWDYKLQNKYKKALPGNANGHSPSLAFPLATDINTKAVGPKPERNQSEDSTNPSLYKGRIASYIEALTNSRRNLVENNLFVFLSSSRSALDGRIVSVAPSSSLVVDVLRQSGVILDEDEVEDIANGNTLIYRNGMRVTLEEELCNGDVLTLPPAIMDSIDF